MATGESEPANRAPLPRRQRVAFIVVAFGIATIVGLIGAELLLRAFSVVEYPPGLMVLDPRRGWVLRPGLRGHTPYAKDVAINSQGLRDREFAVPKPEGVYRILMIGDSLTFGSGVASADSLPKQLEAKLGSAAVEVINAGVPGYGTYQERLLLEDVGLAYQPDLVILGFFHNDLESPRYHGKRWLGARNALSRRLHVYQFLMRQRRLLRARLRPPMPLDYATVPEAAWDAPRAELNRFIDTCRRSNVPVAVAYLGLQYEPMVGARIAAWCAEANVPYCEVRRAYEGRELSSLWVSAQDGHPNAEGQALAAECLAAFLRATPELHVPEARPMTRLPKHEVSAAHA